MSIATTLFAYALLRMPRRARGEDWNAAAAR
jgi:hypothetical protein